MISFFFSPNVAQAGAPQDIYTQVVLNNVSSNYLLDDVECIGTETDIDQCPKSTVHNCNVNQKEFASVTCVKLVNAQPLGERIKQLNIFKLFFFFCIKRVLIVSIYMLFINRQI